MDFEKVLQQREAKASVNTSSEETDQMLVTAIKRVMANSKPGPKPKATSKRNDTANWRPATLFLSVEAKAQMERYLHLTKLDGRSDQAHPGDQSELLDAALREWLANRLPALEQQVIGR
jgi:hypothetical protein